MALYDYRCDDCELEFEVEHSINSKAVASCPKCGGITDHRLIGKSSFTLKGDGWAKDLYAKKQE